MQILSFSSLHDHSKLKNLNLKKRYRFIESSTQFVRKCRASWIFLEFLYLSLYWFSTADLKGLLFGLLGEEEYLQSIRTVSFQPFILKLFWTEENERSFGDYASRSTGSIGSTGVTFEKWSCRSVAFELEITLNLEFWSSKSSKKRSLKQPKVGFC